MRTSNRKVLAAVLCSATLLTGCDWFDSDDDSPVPDTTPAAFAFTDAPGVALSTVQTSNTVTISGIDTATAISVTGGEYSIGCTATFTGAASTISNNQTVCVRHTSSSVPSTATNTVLTVGGVADTFTSTTVAADTTPNAFVFTDTTGVALSTAQTSNTVTITGINTAAAISVTGGEYSIGCTATFTGAASTISNSQTVCVRHTSAATLSTATNTVLTVGGVADTFTSTTTANTLLPFLTGTGELKLFDPTLAASGANPVTVDTGLARTGCSDCFPQATTFLSGTVSGTTISNIHTPRLAYIKRASGNITGGTVFKVDLVQGNSHTPTQISAITDACEFVSGTHLGDLQNVDNSIAVLRRAGFDASCTAQADDVATVIRLNSPTTGAGSTGTDLPLALSVNEPIHAQTNSSGVITGYVTFELAFGTTPVLAHRDPNFLPTPQSPLLTMADFSNAYIRSTDFTHLFVTAKPSGQGLRLYRVESNGVLSSVLHTFASTAFFTPLEGAHDAANLYFTDGGSFLRIAQDAPTASAVVMTTVASAVTINRVNLDTGTTPTRVVFEAADFSTPGAGGVFSVPTNATNATATPLASNSTSVFAQLQNATQGRTYINLRNTSTGAVEALKTNTDGTGTPTQTASAYWAGESFVASFDLAANTHPPSQFIFLATRTDSDGDTLIDDDTLSVVDPATGVTGITLGTINNAQGGNGLSVFGLGRYALVNAHINRGSNNFDHDVYFVDAAMANSLAGLATNAGSNDIPLVFN